LEEKGKRKQGGGGGTNELEQGQSEGKRGPCVRKIRTPETGQWGSAVINFKVRRHMLPDKGMVRGGGTAAPNEGGQHPDRQGDGKVHQYKVRAENKKEGKRERYLYWGSPWYFGGGKKKGGGVGNGKQENTGTWFTGNGIKKRGSNSVSIAGGVWVRKGTEITLNTSEGWGGFRGGIDKSFLSVNRY